MALVGYLTCAISPERISGALCRTVSKSNRNIQVEIFIVRCYDARHECRIEIVGITVLQGVSRAAFLHQQASPPCFKHLQTCNISTT